MYLRGMTEEGMKFNEEGLGNKMQWIPMTKKIGEEISPSLNVPDSYGGQDSALMMDRLGGLS